MGLSNAERRSGIFWAIRRVVENARGLPEHKNDYTKIKEFAEQLWPAYLGVQQNSTHWLWGSSATNDIIGENYTPWDAGVGEQLCNCKEPESESPDFDPFREFLSIKGFLEGPPRAVYTLFQWTEQLVYYLRRYRDAFLRRYLPLSDLCAKIQGECFSQFVDKACYARAYLAHQICEVLYHSLWWREKRDEVVQILLDENFHHNFNNTIRNGEIGLKRLAEIHTALKRIRYADLDKHENRVRRMLFALELAGQYYHYAHQHQKLRAWLKAAAWKTADLAQVDAALLAFCKEKKGSVEKDYVEALFYNKDYDEQQYESGGSQTVREHSADHQGNRRAHAQRHRRKN